MMPTTKHQLKKMETLLNELGFTLRYEKGNFTSGYALVEKRRVAVINKFYDTEGRINVLSDILRNIELPEEAPEGMSPASEKLMKDMRDY